MFIKLNYIDLHMVLAAWLGATVDSLGCKHILWSIIRLLRIVQGVIMAWTLYAICVREKDRGETYLFVNDL